MRYFLIKEMPNSGADSEELTFFFSLFMKVGPLGDRTGALTVTSISGAAPHVDMMMGVSFFSMAKANSTTTHHHIMSNRNGINVSAVCRVVGGFPIPNFFLCAKRLKAAVPGCQRLPRRATGTAVTCSRLIFRDMIFVVQDQVFSIDLKNTTA